MRPWWCPTLSTTLKYFSIQGTFSFDSCYWMVIGCQVLCIILSIAQHLWVFHRLTPHIFFVHLTPVTAVVSSEAFWVAKEWIQSSVFTTNLCHTDLYSTTKFWSVNKESPYFQVQNVVSHALQSRINAICLGIRKHEDREDNCMGGGQTFDSILEVYQS